MTTKNFLFRGTIVLTVVGVLTRVIGFFFRVFLCNIFGEEQVGLYQLIFPIYALCISIASSGIQLAIARCTSKYIACKQPAMSRKFVSAGCVISVLLSLFLFLLMQTTANYISINILKDERCAPLLTAISYALPFASIHSCITGYYLGLKQTKITAISQLLEQIVRVLSVLLIWILFKPSSMHFPITWAAVGIVFGEMSSALYCWIMYFKIGFVKKMSLDISMLKELFNFALPITFNKTSFNILQNIEAISIPLQLKLYGYSSSEALKIYGVLTGIVLPCILFPSAITNSISTVLLPTVTEIQYAGNNNTLKSLIIKTSFMCVLMGGFFMTFFLFCGDWICIKIFSSSTAGNYMKVLLWLCPFLYWNSTLISFLNGIGKTKNTFLINILSLAIRILGVYLGIPACGIIGYLYAILTSQISTTILCLIFLHFFFKKKKDDYQSSSYQKI